MIVNKRLIESIYRYNGMRFFNREDLLQYLLPQFEIDTPQRVAYFLAQIGHESAEFRYRLELLRDKDAERRYGRDRKLGQKLGNFDFGDGAKYKGRGFIQLTGKNNYIAYSNATGVDFVKNPKWVEKDFWALHSALWYWETHKLNYIADQGDFRLLTKRINGGYNGITHRLQLLERAEWAIRKYA